MDRKIGLNTINYNMVYNIENWTNILTRNSLGKSFLNLNLKGKYDNNNIVNHHNIDYDLKIIILLLLM